MPRSLGILLILFALAAGCAPEDVDNRDAERVVILSTEYGDIVLRLYPDLAPEHAKNFLWHAEHSYAGCTFHRVIPGFMIQGGDPLSKDEDPANDGLGGHAYTGPGNKLAAEFNDRPHQRGTLAMARSRDPDSAGSQFFICHSAARFLDGKYTVFGEVIDGIEIVDRIVASPRDDRDRPLAPQRILAARVEGWSPAKIETTRESMRASDGGGS